MLREKKHLPVEIGFSKERAEKPIQQNEKKMKRK
jgi:hypothetical protein